MIPFFIISFRETLEAALIVSIVIGYLKKTGQQQYNRYVYWGIIAAIGASLVIAWIFQRMGSEFTGKFEEIFEGSMMLAGALLLSFVVVWMMRRKKEYRKFLQSGVEREIQHHHPVGIFSLVFVSLLREGVEMVIFVKAASLFMGAVYAGGILAGALVALGVGYGMFAGSKKMNLQRALTISTCILVLFAAGLTARGIHEFQEAGVLPTIVSPLWDINPPIRSDGSYPLLHEKGYIGSMLVGLVGYNGNPSLLEVVGYVVYLSFFALAAGRPRIYSFFQKQKSEFTQS